MDLQKKGPKKRLWRIEKKTWFFLKTQLDGEYVKVIKSSPSSSIPYVQFYFHESNIMYLGDLVLYVQVTSNRRIQIQAKTCKIL